MKLHSIPFEEIFIDKDRQRKEMSAESLIELASSIASVGLIHPIVVRKDEEERFVLVAGERRLRAMEYVWNFGQSVKCGEYSFPAHHAPAVYLGEIDTILAFEIELEENLKRRDLTWQERSSATARLAQLQEKITGEPVSPTKLAEEIGQSPSETGGGGRAAQAVRQDLILAKFLHDPDVAAAKSREEAFKVVKRKEETRRNAEVGAKVGVNLAGEHRLIKGDCLEILPTLLEASFDVILTDPPYGMGAQDFGDSGGAGGALGGHFYDDSPESFQRDAPQWMAALYRVAKPQAHLYWFCDIDWFPWLKQKAVNAGWNPFRTPIIWYNPGGSRAPWPQSGPQRKSQYVLYANKGNRPVTSLLGDIITAGSDPNLNHHAQKPVFLYQELLKRSVRAGDFVLDSFAGTGPIFPAAHGLKCRATGIEKDAAACGIAAKRMEALK